MYLCNQFICKHFHYLQTCLDANGGFSLIVKWLLAIWTSVLEINLPQWYTYIYIYGLFSIIPEIPSP